MKCARFSIILSKTFPVRPCLALFRSNSCSEQLPMMSQFIPSYAHFKMYLTRKTNSCSVRTQTSFRPTSFRDALKRNWLRNASNKWHFYKVHLYEYFQIILDKQINRRDLRLQLYKLSHERENKIIKASYYNVPKITKEFQAHQADYHQIDHWL